MMKQIQRTNYYWSPNQLKKHRRRKLSNAIKRRDYDYLKERQEKFSRVFPQTLGAVAKFTFLKGLGEGQIEQ